MGPPDPRAHQTNRAECDISVSKILGFKTFSIILIVSVSVSEKFSIKKSIGICFENFWYRKKVLVSVSENFGLKKVLVSVSKKIGIKKSISIGFEKFWSQKSIGIGFENFYIEIGHKYS